jgi:hypothetical protein
MTLQEHIDDMTERCQGLRSPSSEPERMPTGEPSLNATAEPIVPGVHINNVSHHINEQFTTSVPCAAPTSTEDVLM